MVTSRVKVTFGSNIKKMADKKASPEELKVDPLVNNYKNRKLESERVRHAKMSRNADFVYVNPGYVGSMSSISPNRLDRAPQPSVIREQYWTCARWPSTQRILAVLVAILFGIVIGLAITMIIRRLQPDLVVFRARPPPD